MTPFSLPLWIRRAYLRLGGIIAAVLCSNVLLLTAADKPSGLPWRTLPLITNGQVDSNWVHVGYGRLVADKGTLRTDCEPQGLGLLVYRKERLGNCQIRVVFRTEDDKSNSGVYVRLADGILEQVGHPGAAFERDAAGQPSEKSLERVKASAEKDEGPWYAVHHGYEVQIAQGTDPFHRTGSIYSLASSSAGSAKSPEEWKVMVITLAGDKIYVDLDDQRITNFDPKDTSLPPRREWHEPKRTPARAQMGYIGLQNHDPGDVVWFKDVSVRPLPTP